MLSLIDFALLQVMESDEEQYKKPCDGCGETLTINTNIMCWNNGKSGDDYEEKTYCDGCYWDFSHQLFSCLLDPFSSKLR